MSTLTVGTIKSNSTSPPAIQNSSGTEIGTLCRAWVNFVGTAATPITPRGSFNVSSVTKTGTGDYTVTFSNALPDTNYSVVGATTGSSTGSTSLSGAGASTDFTYSTSSIRLYSVDCSGNANVDALSINVAIFR